MKIGPAFLKALSYSFGVSQTYLLPLRGTILGRFCFHANEIAGGNVVNVIPHLNMSGFYGMGTNFMSYSDKLDLL